MPLGEECSVGYSSLYQAWTIGLGSRSIFLRGEEDSGIYCENPLLVDLVSIYREWECHLQSLGEEETTLQTYLDQKSLLGRWHH